MKNFLRKKSFRHAATHLMRGLVFVMTLLATATASAQSFPTVTGQVTDTNDEPLIGATVIVKGTSQGTATDLDGQFTLKDVRKGASIVVSYVGYNPQTVQVKDPHIRVYLSESENSLDELVVVGYGTQKKVSMTGAIETVSSKTFEDRAISNPALALQGATPSLVVTRASSRPGHEDLSLVIRGATSVNGGSPLIVIDGVPVLNYEQFFNLNSDDIDNISVLKDGSASIYGAKAANGVILVTTKKGRQGKPTINYAFNMRFNSPGITNYSPDMSEYASMWFAANKEEKIENWWAWLSAENMTPMLSNTAGIYSTAYYGDIFLANTNRLDEMFANRNSYEHAASISGGDEKSNYRVSLSYSDNQANLVTAYDGQKVFNLRLNYSNQIAKWLRFESLATINRTKNSGPTAGLGNQIYGYDMPFFPSKNPYGQWYANFGTVGNRNAVAATSEGGRDNTTRLQGRIDMRLVADIWKGISVEGQASLQAENWMRERWINPVRCYDWFGNPCDRYIDGTQQTAVTPDGPGTGAGYLKASNNSTYQYYSLLARYANTFCEKHDVDVMVGVQGELFSWNNLAAARETFVDYGVYDLNIADPSSTVANSGGKGSSGTFSYIARANYSYDNRYLISLLGRSDGDSKFAEGYRYDQFGSVSAGWIFSNEAFMENVRQYLNHGKIRASYGETGNNAGLGNFLYASGINQYITYMGSPMTAQTNTTLKNSGLINKSLTWERVIQKNIGLDFGLFNNRLTGSFDYYWKDNKGMLSTLTYPSVLGAAAPKSNDGHLAVHGWEITLGWKSHVRDFNYYVNFNIGDSRTMLKELEGATTYGIGKNHAVVGYPLNSFFLYRTAGYFRNQEQVDHYYELYASGNADIAGVAQGSATELRPGDTIRLDLNGDGKIDWSDGDIQYVGDGNPHYTFGFSLGGEWKGFDLNATFQGVGRQYIMRSGWMAYPFVNVFSNQNPTFLGKTWTEDNPDAKYPRLTTYPGRAGWNYNGNDFMLQNARYCRLKNLVVGYTIPQKWTRKIFIEKLRVYFAGNDLWEWSSVRDGYDPEMGELSQIAGYPFTRTYSFGVQVTF